jgi:soluble lytic murein transglycosylase-like protein
VFVLALGACAGRSSQARAARDAHDPVHDPAGEWAAQSARARSRSADAREIPAFVPVAREEPAIQLREFSEAERTRIDRVQPIVRAAAMEHGVPPNVVNGIIWVESKFLPEARGKRGPRGLMQIMPRTGREIARTLGRPYHPHDPDFNIHAGTYYFSRMMRRFKNDPTLALAAYNIGPAKVDGWLRANEPFGEATGRYVDLVLSAADAFRRRGF